MHEDKDKDSFLLDLPSISQSPSSKPTINPSLTPFFPIMKSNSSSPMSLTKVQFTILLNHSRYTIGEKSLLLNQCKSKSWNQSLEMRSVFYLDLLLIIFVLSLIIMILICPVLSGKVQESVPNTLYTHQLSSYPIIDCHLPIKLSLPN